MSNYIALLEIYDTEGKMYRRTQINVRDCIITDLQSLQPHIEAALKRNGFEFSERELASYYIVMLAKVDDTLAQSGDSDAE